MAEDDDEVALEYVRRLYENVLGWYKTAETKAQVLLSLDGIIVSLLVAALFQSRDTTRSMVEEFGVETWAAAGAALVAIAASIGSALLCLTSWVLSRRERVTEFPAVSAAEDHDEPYPPEVMWFFQTVADLDERRFANTARRMSRQRENQALSSQCHVLSRRVLQKHRRVNRGFGFAALALMFLLLAAASYVVRVDAAAVQVA